MRNRTKLLLSTLIAALMFATAVSTASAQRLELSIDKFTMTWTTLAFTAGGVEVRCAVTLEGSFSSLIIKKVFSANVGYINNARIRRPCTNGEAWVLNGTERPTGEERTPATTLPWVILYLDFQGTLPIITGGRFTMDRGGFLVSFVGTSCLYEAERSNPIIGTAEINTTTREVTGFSLEPRTQIRKHSGSILCPAEGAVSGTAAVTRQGSTQKLLIRLIT